ncbi:MAG: hypothetical protein IT452_22200 [Planctomycetia bacterium]|nr:hypothetical protein [Planctomycetia bacterium]
MAGSDSTLLLDDAFERGDDSFVARLGECVRSSKLAAIADRWVRDPRPWARRMQLAYADRPLSRQGHHPLVKRLFKAAEKAGDAERMGAWMVAFDRIVRRRVATGWRWDAAARQSVEEEHLAHPRDSIYAESTSKRTARNPWTGNRVEVEVYNPRGKFLFTKHTRHYLRRRAWRFFRRLGRKDPAAYVAAMAAALRLYRDEDVRDGLALLDCRSLMQACFGASDVLAFGTSSVNVKDGRRLDELQAAPRFPEAWKTPEAGRLLLAMLTDARSRTVRVWARQMVQRDHRAALAALPVEELLRFLDHDDPETAQFGAELLAQATGLETLPVTGWLRLTQTRNLTALGVVCDLMARHVTADRVTLAQAVEMAKSAPVPVSRLGLGFLKGRAVAAGERALVAELAATACAATAGEAAAWALGSGAPGVETATRFFDSPHAAARHAAWDWLPGSPLADDATMWARLCETPYDDVRARMIAALEKRAKSPATARDLAPVWAAVLLGVHRGGRAKLVAVRQLAAAMERDPARADALMPVLRVAARSIRRPEFRAGLAALAGALSRRPELAAALGRHAADIHVRGEVAR